MTDFHVEVVKIGEITPHPNADTLSVTKIYDGYPVVFRTGDFKPGDLAVYIPVDSVVPLDDPRFSFLKSPRIRAIRLRGLFSQGLIIPAEPGMRLGDDVAEVLGITKYVSPEERQEQVRLLSVRPRGPRGFWWQLKRRIRSTIDGRKATCADTKGIPKFDIEPLRRWSHVLVPGEEVIVTEKIHGCNARYLTAPKRLAWCGSRLYLGSRNQWVGSDTVWGEAARGVGLDQVKIPRGVCLFGEVYGRVQKGFSYGLPAGRVSLVLFDALNYVDRCWLDYDRFTELAEDLGLPTVPVLYRGPWVDVANVEHLADGPTVLGKGAHTREGFVIRQRYGRTGRTILKMVGETYLLSS